MRLFFYQLSITFIFLFNSNCKSSDVIEILSDAWTRAPLESWRAHPIETTKDFIQNISENRPKTVTPFHMGQMLGYLKTKAPEHFKESPQILSHLYAGRGPIKLSSTRIMTFEERKKYIRVLYMMGQGLTLKQLSDQHETYLGTMSFSSINTVNQTHLTYSYLFTLLGYFGLENWQGFQKKLEITFSEKYKEYVKTVFSLVLENLNEFYDTSFTFKQFVSDQLKESLKKEVTETPVVVPAEDFHRQHLSYDAVNNDLKKSCQNLQKEYAFWDHQEATTKRIDKLFENHQKQVNRLGTTTDDLKKNCMPFYEILI